MPQLEAVGVAQLQGGEVKSAALVDGERVGEGEPFVRAEWCALRHGTAFGLRRVVVKEVQRERARHGAVQGELHGEALPALLDGTVVAADGKGGFFPPEEGGADEQQYEPGGEQYPVERGRRAAPDEQGLGEGKRCPAVPLVFVGDDHEVCGFLYERE